MNKLSLVLYGFLACAFLCPGCKSIKLSGYDKKGFYSLNDSTLVHSETQALIAPFTETLEKEMNEIIAQNSVNMPRKKDAPESLLGNFVSDLVYQYAQDKTLNIDFCLLNFGGLRTTLPKGTITRGKIYELMPFENNLVVVELSHDSLLALVDYLAQKQGQPISGAQIEIKDQKATQFLIQKNKIDLKQSSDKTYKIITTDYLAKGGDRMTFFSNPTHLKNLQVKLRDVILQHCEEKQNISSFIDERVKLLK